MEIRWKIYTSDYTGRGRFGLSFDGRWLGEFDEDMQRVCLVGDDPKIAVMPTGEQFLCYGSTEGKAMPHNVLAHAFVARQGEER